MAGMAEALLSGLYAATPSTRGMAEDEIPHSVDREPCLASVNGPFTRIVLPGFQYSYM